MKKLLLSFVALATMGLAYAAEPTKIVDFTSVEKVSGSDAGTTLAWDGIDFVLYTANAYTTGNYKAATADAAASGMNYVMLKGNATAPGKLSFKLDFDCAKMVITTPGSPSTNAGNAVTFYANDNKLDYKPINAANAEFTFECGTYTAAGTTYTFEANTASGFKNSQILKIAFYAPTSEASLSATVTNLNFGIAKGGSQTKTITLSVANITEAATVSVNNAAFTVPATVAAADLANGVEVTFNGTTEGISEATVTISANGQTTDVDVEGFAAAHAGTDSDPLTVTDVIGMNSNNAGPFYVIGTIGDKCAANAKDGILQETETIAATNIVLKEGEAAIGVALPAGDVRTALNILDNPGNAGKEVTICGTLETYFGAPGVKNTTAATFTGVENVAAEAAAVEYFNLQGVRVANPANGIFIRRQGNSVNKVLVK